METMQKIKQFIRQYVSPNTRRQKQTNVQAPCKKLINFLKYSQFGKKYEGAVYLTQYLREISVNGTVKKLQLIQLLQLDSKNYYYVLSGQIDLMATGSDGLVINKGRVSDDKILKVGSGGKYWLITNTVSQVFAIRISKVNQISRFYLGREKQQQRLIISALFPQLYKLCSMNFSDIFRPVCLEIGSTYCSTGNKARPFLLLYGELSINKSAKRYNIVSPSIHGLFPIDQIALSQQHMVAKTQCYIAQIDMNHFMFKDQLRALHIRNKPENLAVKRIKTKKSKQLLLRKKLNNTFHYRLKNMKIELKKLQVIKGISDFVCGKQDKKQNSVTYQNLKPDTINEKQPFHAEEQSGELSSFINLSNDKVSYSPNNTLCCRFKQKKIPQSFKRKALSLSRFQTPKDPIVEMTYNFKLKKQYDVRKSFKYLHTNLKVDELFSNL